MDDPPCVDRAQIRAMLDLSPEQRLRVVEEFVKSVLAIRDANGSVPPLLPARLEEAKRRG